MSEKITAGDIVRTANFLWVSNPVSWVVTPHYNACVVVREVLNNTVLSETSD